MKIDTIRKIKTRNGEVISDTTEVSYHCEYCTEQSNDQDVIKEHEKECVYNPDAFKDYEKMAKVGQLYIHDGTSESEYFFLKKIKNYTRYPFIGTKVFFEDGDCNIIERDFLEPRFFPECWTECDEKKYNELLRKILEADYYYIED